MTCSFSKEFSSSGFTDIENTFITEYLSLSDGNAVKVYLYGLFMCQHPEQDKSLKEMADALQMKEKDVVDCFMFWEEFGLVNIIETDPFSVKYLPVHNQYSLKPRKIKAEKYTDFTKSVQTLLPSRMISTNEYTEYFNIMETYNIKPDAMLLIVKYCTGIKGTDISYRYISKVAKDFGNRGITTFSKVEKELSSYNAKTALIHQILSALSLRRQPEIEDSDLLKKWTQELSFDAENILYAASLMKKGSMAKLDEFLMELYSMKSFSKEEIALYVKNKKSVYDLAIRINKALSVYVEVIDTEVNTYVNKWLSFGFDDKTLLYIASVCFKTGNNNLRSMDELISHLRERGFITLSGVGDYFSDLKKEEDFIKKLLSVLGLNRHPNRWDSENLSMWRKWNFSDDMILEAAKLANGKNSPVAYMNGILSNWKNNNIFSSEKITISENSADNNSQESYNKEYERRRSIVLSRVQHNFDIAMGIADFPDVYSRLNSIEKDLAFAEIAEDKQALENLENEKKSLTIKAEELLKTQNLELKNLEPEYFCPKCKDTGYIGTKRCDCFNKKID